MIVNELIKALEKFPWNAEIVAPNEDAEPNDIKSVCFDGKLVWLYEHDMPDNIVVADRD